MLISGEQVRKLASPLGNGLPACSEYNEFLRITGQTDTPDNFVEWSRVAYLLMQSTAGGT